MTEIELGISPCPNDTFIFHALLHGLTDARYLRFKPVIEDVETLNRLVYSGDIPVSKVSFHLLGHLRDRYALLDSGAALGRGCGPLFVTRKGLTHSDALTGSVALPGEFTTAALLLKLYDDSVKNIVYMPFNEIIPAVISGKVSAGVIIHESRFTYQDYELVALADLGEWWEKKSGLPIPLGGIVVSRNLDFNLSCTVEEGIRESVKFAFDNPDASSEFSASLAQEMSKEVMKAHISLYVNEFSVSLGKAGRRAIETLFLEAQKKQIIPSFSGSPFLR